jgi:hypothetical protein
LRGGVISNNHAGRNGGGVTNVSGTLQVSDGIIYGWDSPLNSNTATGIAHSLILGTNHGFPHTSQYGTFAGTAFTSNGILGSSNVTIKVVDGLLVDFSGSSIRNTSNSFNPLPCDLIQYEINLRPARGKYNFLR